MDIFRDPVITPSGVTYERAVLYEHLQKVGVLRTLYVHLTTQEENTREATINLNALSNSSQA